MILYFFLSCLFIHSFLQFFQFGQGIAIDVGLAFCKEALGCNASLQDLTSLIMRLFIIACCQMEGITNEACLLAGHYAPTDPQAMCGSCHTGPLEAMMYLY
ncbi:Transketolase protein [Spatholobus suberectus]|nr:Transketolase protein [Spatholobus suberectus]